MSDESEHLIEQAEMLLADRPTRRPIWLRREGDKVVVLVEINKIWYEIIREHHDGHFSHIWEDNSPPNRRWRQIDEPKATPVAKEVK
jgi:hypothetical protein